MKTKGTRNKLNNRVSKPKTNKIVSKLTYDPNKHKQQNRKKMREKLQSRPPSPNHSSIPVITLNLGAININGLDLEATWAVQQLLDKYSLDVSIQSSLGTNLTSFYYSFWLLVRLLGGLTSTVTQSRSQVSPLGKQNVVEQIREEVDFASFTRMLCVPTAGHPKSQLTLTMSRMRDSGFSSLMARSAWHSYTSMLHARATKTMDICNGMKTYSIWLLQRRSSLGETVSPFSLLEISTLGLAAFLGLSKTLQIRTETLPCSLTL